MNSGKSLSRVQWSLSNPDGISYAFDGIPFICIGTLNYHCHQGEDIDKSTKIKRAKERDENEVLTTLYRHFYYTHFHKFTSDSPGSLF